VIGHVFREGDKSPVPPWITGAFLPPPPDRAKSDASA
jgi:hypothetical protein